jgi:hypothetical protein
LANIILSYLAFFGAIITIIALAVDPFSQQVIRYTSCLQAVNGLTASVAGVNNYTAAVAATTIDPEMASALYVGLLNPPANASAAVSFACSTGNCTFPNARSDDKATHMSLAM